MLAWQRFGEGETPEPTGLKGDHLVGKYYVRFDQEMKKEAALIYENYFSDDVISPPTAKAVNVKLIRETIKKNERSWCSYFHS